MQSPLDIIKETAQKYGLTIEEVVGVRRFSFFVVARRECAKRMEHEGMRLAEIAYYLKRPPHTIKYYLNETHKRPLGKKV